MDHSPQWQPIGRLAAVAAALTGGLADAERMQRRQQEVAPTLIVVGVKVQRSTVDIPLSGGLCPGPCIPTGHFAQPKV